MTDETEKTTEQGTKQTSVQGSVQGSVQESVQLTDQLREFSDKMTPDGFEPPLNHPFTLRIEGKLTESECSRLKDTISQEKLGIRELDLEPQLSAGRILIPRISEYAGILLVQILRDTRACLTLYPSDSEGKDEDSLIYASPPVKAEISSEGGRHPADQVLISTTSRIGERPFEVLDALMVSSTLSCHALDVETSSEYQRLLEDLKKQMKFKAYLKHADAIIDFKVNITPLNLPSEFKLTMLGSAIRWCIKEKSE